MSKFVFLAVSLVIVASLTSADSIQDAFQVAFNPPAQTLTFPSQIQNGQDTLKLYVTEVQQNPIPVQVGTLHPLPLRYIQNPVTKEQIMPAEPLATKPKKDGKEGIIHSIMEAQRAGIHQVSEVAALMINTAERERVQLLQSMIDKKTVSYLMTRIDNTIKSIIDAKLRAIFMIKSKATGFLKTVAGAGKKAADKVMNTIGLGHQRSGETEIEVELTETPVSAPQVIEINLQMIKENLDDLDEFNQKLATASLEQPAKISGNLLDRIVKREPRLESHIKEMLNAGLLIRV